MRVGLVIYGSLDIISGGYLYDRVLVEHLRHQGDRVELVSLPWRNYLRHLGDNFSRALYRQLRELDVDVLLQDELNHPSLFWLNRQLRGKIEYPMMTIVHHLRSSEVHPFWQRCIYRAVERAYLKGLDGFVFNSQTTRQVVHQNFKNLDSRPYVVAYPAGDQLKPQISQAEIAARCMQPGPLRLIFLGNLIPRKGLHILLNALQILPKDRWKLRVIGFHEVDRRYGRMIQRQVQRNGLSEQIQFLGRLGVAQLAEQLKSSHVLIVPSSYEGFGIVYLEGMGFGLPAIATTGGAAWEIITHGENGFLIHPEDVVALADHVMELADNRERLLVLSLAARERFLAHPTWEQTAAKIRAFLCQVVR